MATGRASGTHVRGSPERSGGGVNASMTGSEGLQLYEEFDALASWKDGRMDGWVRGNLGGEAVGGKDGNWAQFCHRRRNGSSLSMGPLLDGAVERWGMCKRFNGWWESGEAVGAASPRVVSVATQHQDAIVCDRVHRGYPMVHRADEQRIA